MRDYEGERLEAVASTKAYCRLSPESTVSLYAETKSYVKKGLVFGAPNGRFYDIVEMLFYLTIYMGQDAEAQTVFVRLRDVFGSNTARIKAMQATLMETSENEGRKRAIEYLERELNEMEFDADTESYLLLKKRLISIQHGGDDKALLTSTLRLLEQFPLDAESWWLCQEIYGRNGNWDRAVYCVEEVVCITPFNYMAFARLGHLLYCKAQQSSKKGDAETLELAMKHALRSVELNEYCMQGWAVVALAGAALARAALAALARDKLREIGARCGAADRATAEFIKV